MGDFMSINAKLLQSLRNNEYTDSELSLVEQGLNDEDIAALCEALRVNNHVKKLDVSVNNITDNGAQALSELPNLTHLNISSNNLGPGGAKALAASQLHCLDITGNLVKEGIAQFREMTTLVELYASECGISDQSAELLLTSRSIEFLDLSTNELSGCGLREISNNHVLKYLSLMQNSLQPDCYTYFSGNTTLETLNLTNTLFDDHGAALLAKGNRLNKLIAMSGCVGDPGAIALSQHPCLRELVLTNNVIAEAGAHALLKNNHFFVLKLSDNKFYQLPTQLKERYKNHYGNTFERDQPFIDSLLKKDLEQELQGTTSGRSISGSASPEVTSLPISPDSSPEQVALAVIAAPQFTPFFQLATQAQKRAFIDDLSQTLGVSLFSDSPNKRQKRTGPDTLKGPV